MNYGMSNEEWSDYDTDWFGYHTASIVQTTTAIKRQHDNLENISHRNVLDAIECYKN